MKRIPMAIFSLLMLVWALGFWLSAKGLPERVATKFSRSGEVTGWTERGDYLWEMGSIGLLLPLGVVAIFWALCWIPSGWLSVPEGGRRWLEPQGRPLLNRLFLNVGAWIGVLQVALFGGLHALTVRANRQEPPEMEQSLVDLGAMVLLALSSLVLLLFLVRLMKPPKED